METNDKPVKSLFFELKMPNRIKLNENGERETVQGECKCVWLLLSQFPDDTLDLGKFWETDGESMLHMVAEDGHAIEEDIDMALEELGSLYDVSPKGVIEELRDAVPGRFVELDVDTGVCADRRRVLRVTAHGYPKLSRENTLRASDLCREAMSRIRIHGKPLYVPGTVEDGESVWFPDARDTAVSAIEADFAYRGGNTAKAKLVSLTLTDAKSAFFEFRISSETEPGLRDFLRKVGVTDPDGVRICRTDGYADGETLVSATLRIASTL